MLAIAQTAKNIPEREFRKVVQLLYRVAGIKLADSKQDLVNSRLRRRLAATGHETYEGYVRFVLSPAGKAEAAEMIDVLTTNKTNFFRETAHFDFFRDHILADAGATPLRVWSAACSTGEEPYSLAITAIEQGRTKPGSIRFLATDICTEALGKAKAAEYRAESVKDVPPSLVSRHFESAGPERVRVAAGPRRLVRFGRLNLMGEWPMRGDMDLVLCCNAMIYFDGPTRAWLGRRFARQLREGAYLFIGHSESLGIDPPGLRNVQPAIYQRTDEALPLTDPRPG